MRLFRALTAAIILVLSFGLVTGESGQARAQDVATAEDAADQAQQQAAAADSLLSSTAARRAGIENDLAASLARLSAINAELTAVSVRLDGLRQSLVTADAEYGEVSDQLQVQAVDAYIRAVTIPATALVGSADPESAIVAMSSIESMMASDQAEIAELAIMRRELERLRAGYLAEQEEVAVLQAAADEEAARLEELLAEADSALAEAVAAARVADAEYRAALDDVTAARAREAERQRQNTRSTTTTTPAAAPAAPTTTAPPSTQPPANPPPPPVAGGPFPPPVERWRATVSQYFAADAVDGALSVMKCESYGDPEAYNPYSGASGLFQFLPSTWATTAPRAGYAGASVFEAEANIAAAAWLTNYYAGQGRNPWAAWHCQP